MKGAGMRSFEEIKNVSEQWHKKYFMGWESGVKASKRSFKIKNILSNN